MAVGLIVDARQAEAIVAGGAADLVALAREAQDDPNFAVHAARELTGGSYDAYPVQAGPAAGRPRAGCSAARPVDRPRPRAGSANPPESPSRDRRRAVRPAGGMTPAEAARRGLRRPARRRARRAGGRRAAAPQLRPRVPARDAPSTSSGTRSGWARRTARRLPMLAAQAWADGRGCAGGRDDGARRMLGMLGVLMVPGYLMERYVRAHLRRGGWTRWRRRSSRRDRRWRRRWRVLGHQDAAGR